MEQNLECTTLVEFGQRVTVDFRGHEVQAFRDRNSGYVFFKPPELDQLNEYYQHEYNDSQFGYYNCNTDYDSGKNTYHADRITEQYESNFYRKPRNCLELGCAYGGLVEEMARRGIDSKGSDLNKDAITQGREKRNNKRIFHADNIEALSTTEEKFDIIYSLHVLEHDPSMLDVIKLCRTKLTDDGFLFISVPNSMFINSVFTGFKENIWVNYPQHLHMLSAGFIPYICKHSGFSPVFWDTRIVFNVQDNVKNLFSEANTSPTRIGLWDVFIAGAGLGMELNFALVPDTGTTAGRLGDKIQMINGSLEHARRAEVNIRQFLEMATH